MKIILEYFNLYLLKFLDTKCTVYSIDDFCSFNKLLLQEEIDCCIFYIDNFEKYQQYIINKYIKGLRPLIICLGEKEKILQMQEYSFIDDFLCLPISNEYLWYKIQFLYNYHSNTKNIFTKIVNKSTNILKLINFNKVEIDILKINLLFNLYELIINKKNIIIYQKVINVLKLLKINVNVINNINFNCLSIIYSMKIQIIIIDILFFHINKNDCQILLDQIDNCVTIQSTNLNEIINLNILLMHDYITYNENQIYL